MIDAVANSFTEAIETQAAAPRAHQRALGGLYWLVLGLVATLGVVVFLVLGWAGHRVYKSQKHALRQMLNAVEAAEAPGEAVVVDDRLLGWALRRDHHGVLRDSVWTVAEDVPAASLLDRLLKTNRQEIVVVATPEDGLVRSLDAAGFTVAQEVGWVPWDVSGKGWSLLGRGRKRIYFAVAPRTAVAPAKGSTVSSEATKRTR